MANDAIEVEGVVTELMWWWVYKVMITDMDLEVTAYAAWKMKRFNIKIIPWDIVKVELSPYEPTKGRITYRSINKTIKKKRPAPKIVSQDSVNPPSRPARPTAESIKRSSTRPKPSTKQSK